MRGGRSGSQCETHDTRQLQHNRKSIARTGRARGPNFHSQVRCTLGMEALTSAIRKEVWAVDKDMPVYNIRTP